MKDNLSEFFSSNLIYWEQKVPIRVKFSDLSGWVKIHQIPHVKFETTTSFSLNFESLFSVMRGNSSVVFLMRLHMIWTKGVHQSAKFQTFGCSCEISQNLYFRLLLLELYKISGKKVQRSYVSWHWRVTQNLKKKTICFWNDKNLVSFDPSNQKSKKFALLLVPFVQSI